MNYRIRDKFTKGNRKIDGRWYYPMESYSLVATAKRRAEYWRTELQKLARVIKVGNEWHVYVAYRGE